MPEIDEILKVLSEDLKKRLLPVPPVPKNFKPLTASAAQLRKYAYPPKPPLSDHVALKIWKAIVSGPLPHSGWEDQVLPLIAGAVPYAPNYNKPGIRGRQETSRNWSGMVTHCEWKKPFQVIFGMWQVPPVSAPSLTADRTYCCSTWVGMDGYLPTSFDMPQIGTSQSVAVEGGVAKPPTYQAWFQWWTRIGPSAPVPFQNLPVDAGDLIACSVEFLASSKVQLTIANVTAGLPLIRQPLTAPSFPIGPGWPPASLGTASGTTAEWVTERPRKIDCPDYLYPLPQFDVVTFTSAAVTSSAGQQDYRPSRVIRMVERFPRKLEVISRTEPKDFPNGTFTVGPGNERRKGGDRAASFGLLFV